MHCVCLFSRVSRYNRKTWSDLKPQLEALAVRASATLTAQLEEREREAREEAQAAAGGVRGGAVIPRRKRGRLMGYDEPPPKRRPEVRVCVCVCMCVCARAHLIAPSRRLLKGGSWVCELTSACKCVWVCACCVCVCVCRVRVAEAVGAAVAEVGAAVTHSLAPPPKVTLPMVTSREVCPPVLTARRGERQREPTHPHLTHTQLTLQQPPQPRPQPTQPPAKGQPPPLHSLPLTAPHQRPVGRVVTLQRPVPVMPRLPQVQ